MSHILKSTLRSNHHFQHGYINLFLKSEQMQKSKFGSLHNRDNCLYPAFQRSFSLSSFSEQLCIKLFTPTMQGRQLITLPNKLNTISHSVRIWNYIVCENCTILQSYKMLFFKSYHHQLCIFTSNEKEPPCHTHNNPHQER